MKLVYIEWLDAYGCGASWQEMKDLTPTPLICRSVGWLAHDGKDCKVIVPHVMQEDHDHAEPQGCGDMTIPTVAIKHMREVNERALMATSRVLRNPKNSKKSKTERGLALTQKDKS